MAREPDPVIHGRNITVVRSGHTYQFTVVKTDDGSPPHLVPLNTELKDAPDLGAREFFSEAWQVARAAARKIGLLP